MSHPILGLDEVVHQRVRLGILAVLAESTRADFTFLRTTLELTDGNLSRHLQVLEASGYVVLEKTFDRRRPRTCVRATKEGQAAFAREVAALRALLSRIDTSGASDDHGR